MCKSTGSPIRNSTGSVADIPLYPGDPLTPNVAATPGATRIPIADAPTLTKIPVLPISYGDAQPLLAALRGPVAPEAWRGPRFFSAVRKSTDGRLAGLPGAPQVVLRLHIHPQLGGGAKGGCQPNGHWGRDSRLAVEHAR